MMFGKKPLWEVLGESVRGSSHARKGKENQDAIAWFPRRGGSRYAILSVSDGHGSAPHFRSDQGSRLAVEIAIIALKEFREAYRRTRSLSLIKNVAEEKLPQLLCRNWREAVKGHLQENPITDKEWAHLEEECPDMLKTIAADPVPGYGATLLAVLVTPGYALLLQLGDGDIITVAGNGKPERPLSKDPGLLANETSSLGTPAPWQEFRTCFQAFHEKYPGLFMVSTDGYANSFPGEDDFLKVGHDLFLMLQKNGVDDIRYNLHEWLKEASRVGSGDDVTLGLIYNKDIS